MSNEKLRQSGSYLLCAGVAFAVPNRLVAIESDSLVTGALLRLHNLGFWLFVLALLMAFLYRRIAAVEALVAAFFCTPLCLYLIAPGIFQSVFRGEYPLGEPVVFAWRVWAILSVASLAAAIYVSVRAFSGPARRPT
jgi:hypothetical protein